MEKKGLGRKFGVGKKAPPELKEIPDVSELRASPITSVARAMFAKPNKTNTKPKPKPKLNAPKPKPQPAKVAPDAFEPAEPVEAAEAQLEVEDKELADLLDAADTKGLTADLQEMGNLIKEEEQQDLYNTTVPTAYVPQTRRGFAEFIKGTYTAFELPEGPITIPEGDKFYPYQKFVRDYMRNDSPYRGILVYHGLGSGKTCTAIAALEALYATAGKKIIVMTPFSLKKNFLSEISFCGFRHFQLNNFWVPLDPKDPTTTLFANQILGLSGKYLKDARNVWVPDFRKPQSESNYATLADTDRDEIRQQILSIVEWHPTKNTSGRIKFISYNGISAKKLMAMACDPNPKKFFDDAVIVVDEIHNLIRLMQGNIQPYMTKVGPGGKKVRRTVPVEEVTQDRWAPSLCKEGTKLYNRGYLFYRLLVDARNSKIVGLSGTPLVNFPEELGILSNVLHGYITTLEGIIQQGGEQALKKAEEVGFKNPYTDYVKAKKDPAGGGIRVLFSLLPYGVRKIENDVGVERIPEEESKPTFEEIVKSIQDDFSAAGVAFSGALKPKAEELLPPFAESFKDNFIAGETVKNKAVLITRLTGLISYYKGSRLELMPRVKSDEVVRVPFSLYAQKAYSFKRSTEIKSELESKGKATVDAVFSQVYELGDSAGANNYKMGSRQACNFAFPPDVTRPSATAKESKEEAEDGEALTGIVTLTEEEEQGEEDQALNVEMEDDEDDIEAAAKEDEAIQEEMYEKVPVTLGEETDALIREYYTSRGEEVPDEYLGLGVKNNEAREAFVKAYEDAGGRPWQEGDAPIEPKGSRTTQKSSPSDIHFGKGIDNEYKQLSNLARTPITIETAGKTATYPSVEHYYQAAKYDSSEAGWIAQIRDAPTPEKAREMGQDKTHKLNVNFKKTSINFFMKRALEVKFQNKELADLLLSTGEKKLVQSEEDRDPPDRAHNYLGKLLMDLRRELREQGEMPQLQGGGKTIAELRAEAKTRKQGNAAAKPVTAKPVAAKPVAAKPLAAPLAATALSDCKQGTKPGEKYKDACARARECLKTLAKSKMTIGDVDGLANYSAKYSAMLEKIAAAPGSSLVYSQFLDMEGIGIFRVAMDVNGYAPIEITLVGNTVAFTKETEASLRRKQPRYLTFSGGEKQEVRRAALDLFNAKFSSLPESMNKILTEAGYTDNKAGELCRVFCITSAGAEGLSLRNVRAVHIMEPYWNEVRLRQVKGRAIRIGSHLDLPEDQRDVSIYTYISCFSEAAQGDRTGPNKIDETLLLHDSVDAKRASELGLPIKPSMTTYVLTTDEMIYTISERKRKIVEALECILKTAAVDCELNYKQNKDKTFKCLPLKGKVGDFIYNPVLEEDIREGSKFEGSESICTGTVKPQELFQKINKVPYFLREILGDSNEVTGYDVFAAKEVDDKGKKILKREMPEKKVGTVGVRKVDGVDKPGPPIKITG